MALLFVNAQGWVVFSSTERSRGAWQKKKKKQSSRELGVLSQGGGKGYSPAGKHFLSWTWIQVALTLRIVDLWKVCICVLDLSFSNNYPLEDQEDQRAEYSPPSDTETIKGPNHGVSQHLLELSCPVLWPLHTRDNLYSNQFQCNRMRGSLLSHQPHSKCSTAE